MNIVGLDDKNYNWNPAANQSDSQARSSLHVKARELLNELYPHDRILEEISLPGTKSMHRKSTLRADLFVPNRNLIVEVHGEQHYKFNSFFFKNKLSFYKAKARDSDKREWCRINSITLVEFNYNEDVDEWRRKIQSVS
tara:strand:+ start:501 stop:917 length:417 start_codon:yes stop_codon:yes gene_type:complete